MAYTTEAAVRTASGFSSTTNITSATIVAYIADADATINSYIADIYTLPLSATCEQVELLSRAITVALLYANEYGEESEGTDKGWRARLEWAMGVLESIRDGKQKLYDADGAELTRSTLKVPIFYPDDADSASGEDQEARLTMKQLF